jgi:hypothetical protein
MLIKAKGTIMFAIIITIVVCFRLIGFTTHNVASVLAAMEVVKRFKASTPASQWLGFDVRVCYLEWKQHYGTPRWVVAVFSTCMVLVVTGVVSGRPTSAEEILKACYFLVALSGFCWTVSFVAMRYMKSVVVKEVKGKYAETLVTQEAVYD